MSVLSVLCYSEKMFHVAADSSDRKSRLRVNKCSKQKQDRGCTGRCVPRRKVVPSAQKMTSPVIHMSITSGL